MQLPTIDILSPLDTLYARLRYGRLHTFTIQVTAGRNAYQVEKALRQYGVRVWNRKIVGKHERSFSVRYRQRKWAEYVLARHDVAITGGQVDPRNAIYAARHPHGSRPKPWRKFGIGARSFIDHLGEIMAALTNKTN